MRQSVCVDLDGVLAQYDHWRGIHHIGDPIPGAVEFTYELGKLARVIILTCRCKGDGPGRNDDPVMLAGLVSAWLTKHGFYFDEVYIGQGKPVAAAYIDDRAIMCRPQESANMLYGTNYAYRSALVGIRELIGSAK